jgi:hypothetical protein
VKSEFKTVYSKKGDCINKLIIKFVITIIQNVTETNNKITSLDSGIFFLIYRFRFVSFKNSALILNTKNMKNIACILTILIIISCSSDLVEDLKLCSGMMIYSGSNSFQYIDIDDCYSESIISIDEEGNGVARLIFPDSIPCENYPSVSLSGGL